MNLWQRMRHHYLQTRLHDSRFSTLFDAPPADEWVSIDCETSSLDPQHAELLSIAAIPVCGNRILLSRALRLTVHPERAIEAASIPIHQLRQQDVAHGLPVRDALTELLAFIGPRPLLGYYLEFDLAVLNRQIRPWLGIPLPNQPLEVSGMYYDRKVTAYRPEVDLTLDTILSELDLPALPRHDPLNDALLAAMIFLKLRSFGQGSIRKPD